MRPIYAEIVCHGITIGLTPAWVEVVDAECDREDAHSRHSDPVELLASEPAPRVQA